MIPLPDAFRDGPSPEAMRSAGFAGGAAARILHAFAACRATLSGAHAGFFVPGRIEILGKHTDYAGGRSLVCAVDRGFTAVVTRRADRVVRIMDAEGGASVELTIDAALPDRPGHWSDYARTVVRRLARDHGISVGADIAFVSDLPRAAGVSSSSALVIALLLALGEANGLTEGDDGLEDRIALAGYAAAVESGRSFAESPEDRGVGTLGGSQDHTAILCARPNAIACFSYAPIREEAWAALPEGYTFVVAASGVPAEKTAAARERYNRLSTLAAEAAARWRLRTGRTEHHLGAILAAGQAEILLDLLRGSGPDADDLVCRAEQFITESGELVPAATGALEAGSLDRFGRLVERSQSLAETHLGNQVDETRALVRLARERVAPAASAFGAGFGGSVWALVPSRGATAFAMDWLEAYRAEHPDRIEASAFVSPAAPAALRIA